MTTAKKINQLELPLGWGAGSAMPPRPVRRSRPAAPAPDLPPIVILGAYEDGTPKMYAPTPAGIVRLQKARRWVDVYPLDGSGGDG